MRRLMLSTIVLGDGGRRRLFSPSLDAFSDVLLTVSG